MKTISSLFVVFVVFVTSTALAAPINFSCRDSCAPFNASWQYPERAVACMKNCSKCRSTDVNNRYWCTNDALPTCECLK